jgi:hypothetical protein
MSTGDRGIHCHRPVDDPCFLCGAEQLGQHRIPGAVFTHAPMPGPDRLPRPEHLGHIPPGDPAAVLRDTAASLAIQAGASVVAVARLLGHESAATTLNHYAGLFPTDLDDVAVRLDAAAREAVGDQ